MNDQQPQLKSPPARPVGRPRKLTSTQVLAAATDTANTSGLGALSLRSVGKALGVAPMTVRRTVGEIEHLRLEVVRHAAAQFLGAIVWPHEWRDVVVAFALATRNLFINHPFMLEAHHTRLLRELTELKEPSRRVIAALTRQGLRRTDAVAALSALIAYVAGQVHPTNKSPESLEQTADCQGYGARLNDSTDMQSFSFGLETLLDGLELARMGDAATAAESSEKRRMAPMHSSAATRAHS